MPNPFRELRLITRHTQERLAEMANVSPQYIVRAEQYLFETPSPKLLKTYSALSREQSELPAMDEEGIKKMYWNGRRTYRFYMNRFIRSGVVNFLNATHNEPTTHVYYRKTFTKSSMAYCKLLCIQPSRLTNYESIRSTATNWRMPEFIVKAYREANVEVEYLDELQELLERTPRGTWP